MERSQNAWSRRKFITTVTGVGGAIMFNPLSSWAVNETDPRVVKIVAKTIGIDSHNHIDVSLNPTESSGPKVDLAEEIKKSGLSAICTTFAVDYQKLTKVGEAYERFINGMDAMDEVLKSNDMIRSLTLADVKAAHKKHKPSVIQSVEGGHFLEGKLDRLSVAYGRGLRHLGLLHDNDASVPLGDIYTRPAQWGGLTAFGETVIKECNILGILVDLTHCNNNTINAALKMKTKPVIISHTGLDTQLGQNATLAKMMMPRLISKEQAKIVADAGGVIGVWTHLAETPSEYAQNIRAMVDAVGIDHVCIGTDTKLTLANRSAGSFGSNPKDPTSQSANGNAGNRQDERPRDYNDNKNADESKNRGRPGECTNEAWQDQKEGFYYTVVDAMLKTGFTEDEIGKVGSGNFCRVFDAATAGNQ